ncbi:MAG TPA: hypothetical protein VGB54_04015 [Allosphingosinicella sp.]
MKLRHMMFATLVAGAVALPASGQYVRTDTPRSNLPAENALIDVLRETYVRGDGANGVPAGVNVFYTVQALNRCAPSIQLWGGPADTSAHAPLGRSKSLPVSRIANLVAQGGTQLKVEFNTGSELVLVTNSDAHRRQLINALHAFGNACRGRAG